MGSVRGEAITVVSEDESGARIFALHAPTYLSLGISLNYSIKYSKYVSLAFYTNIYERQSFVLSCEIFSAGQDEIVIAY